MTAAADRHFLFGLLALQNGLIDQVALFTAFRAWTRDKSKSLADHPEARGVVTGTPLVCGSRRCFPVKCLLLSCNSGTAFGLVLAFDASQSDVAAAHRVLQSLQDDLGLVGARQGDPSVDKEKGHAVDPEPSSPLFLQRTSPAPWLLARKPSTSVRSMPASTARSQSTCLLPMSRPSVK